MSFASVSSSFFRLTNACFLLPRNRNCWRHQRALMYSAKFCPNERAGRPWTLSVKRTGHSSQLDTYFRRSSSVLMISFQLLVCLVAFMMPDCRYHGILAIHAVLYLLSSITAV